MLSYVILFSTMKRLIHANPKRECQILCRAALKVSFVSRKTPYFVVYYYNLFQSLGINVVTLFYKTNKNNKKTSKL